MAAELLLRHGYRRVTVDDVAAGAGIGKGTVYLHWKSREELFTAVFEREVLHAIGELLRALRQDPQVCLLHRLARAYFLAVMHQPLLRGFVLGDADLPGKLANPAAVPATSGTACCPAAASSCSPSTACCATTRM